MAHDVFISYATKDKPVADAICAALEAESIRCWISPRDIIPGRPYSGQITRAIENGRVMVLLFSSNSNVSEDVLREVQLAARSRVHILNFKIEDVVASDDMEYYLSVPHWLDAMTPPLEKHLAQLVRSVRTLLEERKPAAVSTAAPVAPAVSPILEAPANSTPAAADVGPRERVQPIKSTEPPQIPARAETPGAGRPTGMRKIAIAMGAALLLLLAIFVMSKLGRRETAAVSPLSVQNEVTPTPATAAPTIVAESTPLTAATPSTVRAPTPATFAIQILPSPPFAEQLAASVKVITPVKLKIRSKTPNKVTDDKAWFAANGLEPPTEKSDPPPSVPASYRNLYFQAIHDGEVTLLIGVRGDTDPPVILRIGEEGAASFGFDLRNYVNAPAQGNEYTVQHPIYAQERDGILYFSTSHLTYAKESGDKNAFITAISTKDGSFLWQSRPLVANAGNFVVLGDCIITGYGYTEEPDYVFVLNRWTGAMLDRIKVNSGPEVLLIKDAELYVRTYDTNYVFEVSPRP